MFSTFDCAVKGIRKKEDPYNSIIAGFFTGGALAARGGYKAARNGAIMCAIFLAVIEGVGIGIQRFMADSTRLDVSIYPENHHQVHLSLIENSFPLPIHLTLGESRHEWRSPPFHISSRRLSFWNTSHTLKHSPLTSLLHLVDEIFACIAGVQTVCFRTWVQSSKDPRCAGVVVTYWVVEFRQ